MARAAKAKRQTVAKLNRYAELSNEIKELSSSSKAESSSSSKGKGKGKGKGKSPKSPSSTAKERITKEMEGIEEWLMSKKYVTVETENNMRMLVQIAQKCGYEGKIKIKGRDPVVKEEMRKIARNAGMKFIYRLCHIQLLWIMQGVCRIYYSDA